MQAHQQVRLRTPGRVLPQGLQEQAVHRQGEIYIITLLYINNTYFNVGVKHCVKVHLLQFFPNIFPDFAGRAGQTGSEQKRAAEGMEGDQVLRLLET